MEYPIKVSERCKEILWVRNSALWYNFICGVSKRGGGGLGLFVFFIL